MEYSKIRRIVVFGDGLSDMGRWGSLTNCKYPPAIQGFFESRWTNGPVWIELVADYFGVKLSLDDNFAMGGATSGLYNINEPLKPMLHLDPEVSLTGMLGQVIQYLEKSGAADDDILYVLWSGGHDISSFLQYGQPDLNLYPPADNYFKAVELLVHGGARNFLVGNMPDLGITPDILNTPDQALATLLCQDLCDGIARLASTSIVNGLNFRVLDAAGLFARVGRNLLDYGFKYTEPYLPFEIIDFGNPLMANNVVPINVANGMNPDEFLNWWAVSVSAAMHRIIAKEAIKLIMK